jgi:predicted enzyme related to lactoylglutathione lyase
LARFWSELLGWPRIYEDDDEVVIEKDGAGPGLLFGKSPDVKTVKNRWHLDLTPDDQEAEVERAKALGAREVNIGQDDVSWVVLADPEGNEFCILNPREE